MQRCASAARARPNPTHVNAPVAGSNDVNEPELGPTLPAVDPGKGSGTSANVRAGLSASRAYVSSWLADVVENAVFQGVVYLAR
jgi:hypothetical protein